MIPSPEPATIRRLNRPIKRAETGPTIGSQSNTYTQQHLLMKSKCEFFLFQNKGGLDCSSAFYWLISRHLPRIVCDVCRGIFRVFGCSGQLWCLPASKVVGAVHFLSVRVKQKNQCYGKRTLKTKEKLEFSCLG